MAKKQIGRKSQLVIQVVALIISIAFIIFIVYYHQENKAIIQLIYFSLLLLFQTIFMNNFEYKENEKAKQISKKIYSGFLVLFLIILMILATVTITSPSEKIKLIGTISTSLFMILTFILSTLFRLKK